jgi:glyoxylase-like metal-dependent hydrolase (beta-lactamase superfamily II)
VTPVEPEVRGSPTGIWWLALGYFGSYVWFSALVTALTHGLLPALLGSASGFEILPAAALGAVATSLVGISVLGWWKYCNVRQCLGVPVPVPSRITLRSGLCYAVIIETTILAYSFKGMSIVFALLLMRGGVLTIAPVVDWMGRRKVHWYSWGSLGLSLLATLETHVHADHVTGASLLKQRTGSKIMLSAESGAEGADRYLTQDDVIAFGGRRLMVRTTPGHTNGCLTYVLDDHSMAFTGDCLMIRGAGRTDFQGGDAAAMYRSIHEQIFTLPDDCLLYPAHDYRGLTVTSVAEERRFNPRIGGEIGVGDFTGYMKNLGLAHPKLMDIAVPANLRCGRPDSEGAADQPPADPGWAPLRYSFAGVWEIEPLGLEEHASSVQILDVREFTEFTGPLGHIADSRLAFSLDDRVRLERRR